jgi:hypothetical protein
MPATGLSGRFTTITRGDAFLGMTGAGDVGRGRAHGALLQGAPWLL